MEIIYKLTNLSKEDGKRFYIGSKTEADLIDIDGIPTIVSLKTSTPYYGSSQSYEFKEDFKKGNIFSAEVLETCNNRTNLLEQEAYYISNLNAIKSEEYYNLANPLNYNYDGENIGNIYGETINTIAASRSKYSKRRTSCKNLGFNNISELCEIIYLKKKSGKTYDQISQEYNKNRHFFGRIILFYNTPNFLEEKENLLNNENEKKILTEKIRNMISKNSSYENIAKTLNINFLTFDWLSNNWDLEPKTFHNACLRGLTVDELAKKITKKVLEGSSIKESANYYNLDNNTATRYFLKYIRNNLIINDD